MERTISARLLVPLIASVAMSALAPAAAGAATIDVSSSLDNTTNDQLCTLREAVNAANTNAVVNPANGPDCPAGESANTDLIELDPGPYALSLAGSGESNNVSGDLDVIVSPAAGSVQIDGASAASTSINASDLDRAIDLHSGPGTLTLTNLTVTNGTAASEYGGAIRAGNSSNLTLNSVAVSDSVSPFGGGGIYSGTTGTLAIGNSAVTNNAANVIGFGDIGGGILQTSGTLNLTDSTLADNAVNQTNPGVGADIAGGGIASSNATVNVTRSTVSGNDLNMVTPGNIDFPSGGGISAQNTSVTITDSTLSGNTLNGGKNRSGGGIRFFEPDTPGPPDDKLVVQNSTFSGNDASSVNFSSGGAIAVAGGVNKIFNSTFANNNGTNGQDINYQSVFGQIGYSLTVAGSIFEEDGVDECQLPSATPTSGGYNLDRGTSCGLATGTDQPSTDPLLGPLASNGGATQTYALNTGSAGIDDIPAVACDQANGSPLTADQRGVPRPFPAGGACDIGAYERFTCNGTPFDGPGAFSGCPSPAMPQVNPQAKKCKKKKRKKRSAAAAKKCKKKKKK